MPENPTGDLLSRIPNYSAVLFDWDGTLADTHHAHYRALRDTMASFQMPVDWQWFVNRTGLSAAETIEALSYLHGRRPPVPVADLVDLCEARYLDHLDSVREITWVADIARATSRMKPLAVASGGQRRTIEATMVYLGLDGVFDDLITREEAKEGKPSPDIFLIAAARLGAVPGECLVLEDSDTGILAASRAGMDVVDIRNQQSLVQRYKGGHPCPDPDTHSSDTKNATTSSRC